MHFNLLFLHTIRNCSVVTAVGLLIKNDFGIKKYWQSIWTNNKRELLFAYIFIRCTTSTFRAIVVYTYVYGVIPSFLYLIKETLIITVGSMWEDENDKNASNDFKSILLCWLLWYYGIIITLNLVAAILVLIRWIYMVL